MKANCELKSRFRCGCRQSFANGIWLETKEIERYGSERGELCFTSIMGLNSISETCAKWWRRHIMDWATNLRRQVRRAVFSPRLAWGYHGFRRAVKRRQWREVHRRLMPLAAAAEQARDTRLLSEMAHAAGRLDESSLATQWAYSNAQLLGNVKPTDWQGEDLSDATLVIYFMESEKQGLAIGLNLAGYVAAAAVNARHCVLVVEKRLVPIYSRTLPEVQVRAFPADVTAESGTRLVTANALTLAAMLGTAPAEIESRFLPLQVDAAESAEIRRTYQAGRELPLVGISWWSSHFGKDLPSIGDWAGLVRSVDAIFVNIQYGNVAVDWAVLQQAAPGRVVQDESVDQLVDMDRFASQLGALDAIVTISNTGAHLAGGMGLPVYLIRDDWFRRGWPVLTDRTPWYPGAVVFGKKGRSWLDVFDGVKNQLEGNPIRRN